MGTFHVPSARSAKLRQHRNPADGTRERACYFPPASHRHPLNRIFVTTNDENLAAVRRSGLADVARADGAPERVETASAGTYVGQLGIRRPGPTEHRIASSLSEGVSLEFRCFSVASASVTE